MTFRDLFRAVANHHVGTDKLSARFVAYCRNNEIIELETLASGDVIHSDDAFCCARCQEAHHYDDARDVHTSTRRLNDTECWCESCADHHAFVCDNTSERYADDAFTLIHVDGDDWCSEANEDDYYYHERSDTYSREPEEDEEDEGPIAGYHDTPRPWRNAPPVGDVYGVELETLAPSSDALQDVADAADAAGFIAERDGSLDDECGVEIVGTPQTLADHQDDGGAWARLIVRLKRIGVTSHTAGKGYGMHVSINRASLSELVGARVVAFINEQDELGDLVARRPASSWAKYRCDRKRGLIVRGKLLAETDKYEAAAVRGRRIEVRIFRGTLKVESFRRNVEYCAAVVAFARVALMVEMTADALCAFVGRNRATYPNLADFLTIAGRVRPVKRAPAAAAA